jgi:hypothetical protein
LGFVQSECGPPSRLSWQPFFAGAAKAHHASLHDDNFTDGIFGRATKPAFSSIFQYQSNGARQALSAFFDGSTLPVRAGNLRAVADEPPAITLENGCELVPHKGILAAFTRG